MPPTFDPHLLQALALTCPLVAVAAVCHRLAARRISGGHPVLTPDQRRRLGLARSLSSLFLAFGVAIIWRAELHALMLSLTAVLVALVIASKELIQCVTGAVLSGTHRGIRVGDWVEVAGVRGEVIDRSLLTTTLLETGDGTFGYAYSGRTLVVPNVQLFAGATRRQRFGREFVVHRICVIFDRGPGTAEALHVWQSEAARLAEPFAPRAEAARRAIGAEIGGIVGSSMPKTRLSTTELGKMCLEAELFCPTEQAAALEARLTTSFLDWLSARAAIAGFARRFDGANANAAAAVEMHEGAGRAA